MLIRRANLHDDAELDAYYGVYAASEHADRPDAPLMSKAELRTYFTSDIATDVFHAYAGFDDDRIVAVGFTIHSELDNLDSAELYVALDPSSRRRGHGGELLSHLVEECRGLGRHRLTAESWLPESERDTHRNRVFAEKHGFALANVEIRRVRPLPVADDLLDSWAHDAAPHHDGYRVETFAGAVPDELVPSLVEAMNLMGVEMPTGDIEVEERALTPELFHAREARSAEGGKQMRRAIAIAPDGTVAGFTTLSVPLHEPDIVYQYGTMVRRAHRGHRLGLAMKAANLRATQQAHPDRTYIDTCNAETNGPMVSINEQMGFRPVEVLAHLQRILPPEPHQGDTTA